MSIPVPLRLIAAAALVVPIASACAPNEPIATTEGTTPSIWTGSPSPSAAPGEGGGEGEASAAEGEALTAELKNPGGTTVATAEIAFTEDYATVTVQTVAPGLLTPGFHGLHIHSVGKCEPNSVAPTGGAPANFNSAGGHLQVEGRTGHPMSGDLSSLFIHEDGTGELVTTTDAFTAENLLDGQGTAIMIHEKADNFGNIPPEKYQQVNGTPGPDENTMMTGDAGGRVACGVISGP